MMSFADPAIGRGTIHRQEDRRAGNASARTELASDGSPRPSVETFAIRCTQYQESPIFLWTKWSAIFSYAKIVAVETKGGKTEYILH